MSLPPDPHDVYTAGDPPEDGPRALKHRLAAECRRSIESIALLDISRCDLGKLKEMVDEAQTLADELEELPDLRRFGGLAKAGANDSALMERSGITGRSNPLAPPLRMRVEGEVIKGHVVYSAPYEGPPDCLHGGFVAAAFDDLLGFAQMASGTAGYTGTLTVRMRKPTPLYKRIDYEAGLEGVKGRKIVCWGRSWDGDLLLAEAEILFIAPRDFRLVDTLGGQGG